MKAKLIASVVAVPLAFLSSHAFAAEPVSLSASQMDSITAGYPDRTGGLAPSGYGLSSLPSLQLGGEGGLPLQWPGAGGQTAGGLEGINITQGGIGILRGGNAKPIYASFY